MIRIKKSKLIDISLILLILLLNPIISTFIFETKSSLPDTYAYIAQAENLYRNFQFHTGAWGHIDNSLILPPLYPLLIAFFITFGMSGIDSAILISQLSGFLFSIFAFLYLCAFTNRIVAVVSVLSIQLTYIYFNFASLALTEALFIALLSGTLLLIYKFINKPDKAMFIYPVILGIACSLVFLSREIGITILILVLIFSLFNILQEGIHPGNTSYKKVIMIIFGFSILTIPYYYVRTIQTGQDPLSRNFRLGDYMVEISDVHIVRKIEMLKTTTVNTYIEIYKTRRELMELLPDSSEMLGYVVYADNDKEKYKIYSRIISTIQTPEKYIGQIFDKLILLKMGAGTGVFILFVILSITAFLYPVSARSRRTRIIIPLFVVLYLLLLAVFPSQISRYVEIIIPLLLIHICLELYVLIDSFAGKKMMSKNIVTGTILIIFPVIVLAGSPKLFYDKQIFSHNELMNKKLDELSAVVNGEPVFTQFPAVAYSVGGQYRLLPNDRIDKVARYAGKTGVRWMLLVLVPEEREVIQYWTNANEWIFLGNLEQYYPEIVEYCCGWHDDESESDWRLYSFKY